jgi:hypothetical protein
MPLPNNIINSRIINNNINFIYKIILPLILIFITVMFVLGFKIKKKENNESWINYQNIPFGNIKTGKDDPLIFYNRPQYRLPYRYPLGFKTSYPIKHITPFMI